MFQKGVVLDTIQMLKLKANIGGFRWGSGGSKGEAMMLAPSGSKFFQFHAVLEEIWQNRILVPPGELVPPPLGNPGSTPGGRVGGGGGVVWGSGWREGTPDKIVCWRLAPPMDNPRLTLANIVIYYKQDCIPVGCIPPAHWPYLSSMLCCGGVCCGGVCSGEGCLLQGVPGPRGVSAVGRGGRCLVPGGSALGGGIPARTEADLSREQKDNQV